jgi:hypothetical protein
MGAAVVSPVDELRAAAVKARIDGAKSLSHLLEMAADQLEHCITWWEGERQKGRLSVPVGDLVARHYGDSLEVAREVNEEKP